MSNFQERFVLKLAKGHKIDLAVQGGTWSEDDVRRVKEACAALFAKQPDCSFFLRLKEPRKSKLLGPQGLWAKKKASDAPAQDELHAR
ncbi:unnamed protein product, partial [Pedinophyceae sp. YPF-701]